MQKYVLGLFLMPLWLCAAALNVYTAPSKIYTNPAPLKSIKGQYGEITYNRMMDYVRFINEMREKKYSEEVLLNKVNLYVNGYVSESDGLAWGVGDKWLTREQFLLKGTGDCEEYAITKYFTLLDLGVDQDKLYMGVTDDHLYNQGHMVLLYYPTLYSIPLVYDNASFKVLRLHERKDLTLRYIFNHSGNYSVKENGIIIPKKNPKKITYTKPFFELLKSDKKNHYFK